MKPKSSLPKGLPSFDTFVTATEKSTLVARLLSDIVGRIGGGNGRCIVSDNYPRIGQMYDDRWQVNGYHLKCVNHVLTIYLMVVDMEEGSDGTIYQLAGPTLSVTDAAYERAQQLQSKENAKSLIKHLNLLYSRHAEHELRIFADQIGHYIDSGRRHGSLEITRDHVGISNIAIPMAVVD
jgi:hypothetical protein